ncbi:nucleotidyltransferase family protein [Crossiella cryophila]|uniref:Nucleotidyltransferase family protein n=1 Tax=Crossiella cryophila TaxID=43355 RepID=A0A7W7CD12_9PSEU|nr:nucleotidyltransferase family protein [Crossiella cryophila]MBB4678782.1 hypothetical protein [Crossiella cryophila]
MTTLHKSRVRSRLQTPPLTAADIARLTELARFPAEGRPLRHPVPHRGDPLAGLLDRHRLDGIAAAAGQAPASPAPGPALAEADTVLATLAAARVRALRLKGSWIAGELYPRPAMRPMSDVDLLVSEQDNGRAVVALRQAGYRVVPGQEFNGTSKRLHGAQLHHPDRGVPVELHHRIARQLPLSRLARLLGLSPSACALPPVAHLLHRLLDIAKDGWARTGLLPYTDVLLLLRQAQVRVPELLDLAVAARVPGASASALLAFDALLGPELTAAELARCRRLEPAAVRLARLAALRQDGGWRVRYTPRWQRRIIRLALGRTY